MIIPIDEKYRLKSDKDQWMIQKFRPTKRDPDEWTSFKYFHYPQEAVNALLHLQIRASDAQTLADALVDVEKLTTQLVVALTPFLIVKEREE
jgi:hypothetical protein